MSLGQIVVRWYLLREGNISDLKISSGKHTYCNDISIQEIPQDVQYFNPYYELWRTQPICLPYKANAQENFWDNKTGVITGYAHQDKAATYLGNTQMTTLPITRCNQIIDEEMERIKECKFPTLKFSISFCQIFSTVESWFKKDFRSDQNLS